MNTQPTVVAQPAQRFPRNAKRTTKPLITIALSAHLTVLIQLVPASTSAQIPGAGRRPVLVLQQGDVPSGTGQRWVNTLSGPVNAGGDNVGIAATLSNGGEGALLVRHHSVRRNDLILAHDVGALSFYPNRFGILAESLWGGSDESPLPFAIKAIMKDSNSALLTAWGVAQWFGAPAPGLPEGTQVTGIQRIQMLENGQTYWLADWLAPAESGKAFFRRQPGMKGSVDLLMNKGDMICDGVLENLRHFRVAQGQTHGQVVDVHTEAGNRTALYVDGKCPFVVGEPLPSSQEIPTMFWHFDLNSSGQVLFGAITDQPAYRNGVIVFDGKVVMREGDVIDGVRIAPPSAEPNEVRIDDRGRAVTLWTGPVSSNYTIFYTPDVTRFEDTRKLVSENTPLDFDGDGLVDATLYQFRFFTFSGPTFSLGETGIYIAVWLRYPGSSEDIAAIVFYPF